MTNYEKIKDMTVEEMAHELRKDECLFCVGTSDGKTQYDEGCNYNGACADGIQEWLESEVRNDC